MKYTSSAKVKILLLLLFIILSVGSFIYNRHLIQEMEKKERYNVELWAKALRLIGSPELSLTEVDLQHQIASLDSLDIPKSAKLSLKNELERNIARLTDLSLSFAADMVLDAREFRIPTIQIDSAGTILQSVHVDEIGKEPDSLIVQRFIAAGNEPISFEVGLGTRAQIQKVYYMESAVIKLMRYFPYFQLLFFGSLLALGYSSFSSIRRSEQSNLWVGMAKEAAHQLGTPISSLIGWLEILKDQVNKEGKEILLELDHDVARLQRVADRFNKIGSKPDLKPIDLNKTINSVITYMEKRLPSLGAEVRLSVSSPDKISFKANEQLLEWAFENITKNAIDALQGVDKAYVSYVVSLQKATVTIDIEDNGKGIEASNVNQIFKPGYSTKSRGWGLGLSLTKRIFEEYHGGKVFVLRSRPAAGTTFRVILPLTANG